MWEDFKDSWLGQGIWFILNGIFLPIVIIGFWYEDYKFGGFHKIGELSQKNYIKYVGYSLLGLLLWILMLMLILSKI